MCVKIKFPSSQQHSLFLDVALLGDVDTVQELSNILISDQSGLVDQSARQGDVVQVVSFDGDLILDILLLGDLNTLEHLNPSVVSLTNEILNFDGLVVLGDVGVDWEMGISESHFVLVALDDTVDHVSDVRSDGDGGGFLLSLGEPHLDSEDISLLLVLGSQHIESEMAEVSLQGASGAGNGDISVLVRDGDALGNIDVFLGKNVFHFCVGE
jgi:hypothetical protein